VPADPIPPWLGFIVIGLVAASIGTWVVLLRRLRQGPLLPYEPRRPVPWGAVGPMLLMLFVFSRIASVTLGDGPPQLDDFDSPQQMVEQIAGSVVAQLVLFGAFFVAIAVMSGATLRDVGLPEWVHELLRDVKIGVVTWLAALVPIYGLQWLFVTMGDEPSSHPLIEVMLKEPNALVFVLTFVSAVIVAPLSEEVAFRLLLQGWLEKLEDQLLGWRKVADVSHESPAEETPAIAESPEPLPAYVPTEPPTHGMFGLPYGWAPIIVSSALFAAAHMGHGPDPIPLFFLAAMLGYVYQRTHRIVPCIVTHLLFNLTSLAMLVLTIVFGGDVPP
jgi:membrane protease YdiL (CAAX protease family)